MVASTVYCGKISNHNAILFEGMKTQGKQVMTLQSAQVNFLCKEDMTFNVDETNYHKSKQE